MRVITRRLAETAETAETRNNGAGLTNRATRGLELVELVNKIGFCDGSGRSRWPWVNRHLLRSRPTGCPDIDAIDELALKRCLSGFEHNLQARPVFCVIALRDETNRVVFRRCHDKEF